MIVKEQEKAEEHRRKQQELAWNILPRRQSSRIAISKIKTQSSHDSEVRSVASAFACVWCKHLTHYLVMCACVICRWTTSRATMSSGLGARLGLEARTVTSRRTPSSNWQSTGTIELTR